MAKHYKYFERLLDKYQRSQARIESRATAATTGTKEELSLVEQRKELMEVPVREVSLEESVGVFGIEVPKPLVPVDLPNFRWTNYIGKTRAESQLIEMEQAMPVPSFHYENWWEYDSFKNFPKNPDYFIDRFEFWHRSKISDKNIAPYGSLWDPKDTNLDFYMYYFATVPRYLPAWKYSVPTHILYESNRPLIYISFTLMVFGLYIFDKYFKQKREPLIYLNEDYWIRDIQKMIKTASSHSPTGVFSDTQSLSIPIGFDKFFLAFFYGFNTNKYAQTVHDKFNKATREETEAFLRKELGV